MSSDAEVAWAAGLFEGEGSIQIPARLNGVWLHLGMTDRDIVERFHGVVGAGGICTTLANRSKPMHVWHLAKRAEVQRVLMELLPWFGDRRGARAREGLAFIMSFNRCCGRDGCDVIFLAGRTDRVYCCNACAVAAKRDRARIREAA